MTTTFFGWLLVVVGAVLLVAVAGLLAFARTSVRWLSVPGQILEASRDAPSSSVGRSDSYRLRLLYEYDVGGRRLQGTRIRFGDVIWNGLSQRTVNALVARYPPGREVTVYYDPEHPQRCALDRSLEGLPFYPTMAVAAILLLGGIGVLFGWVKVM